MITKQVILLSLLLLTPLTVFSQPKLDQHQISQRPTDSELTSLPIDINLVQLESQIKAIPSRIVIVFASRENPKRKIKYKTSVDPNGKILERLMNRPDLEIIKVKCKKNMLPEVKFLLGTLVTILPITDWIK